MTAAGKAGAAEVTFEVFSAITGCAAVGTGNGAGTATGVVGLSDSGNADPALTPVMLGTAAGGTTGALGGVAGGGLLLFDDSVPFETDATSVGGVSIVDELIGTFGGSAGANVSDGTGTGLGTVGRTVGAEGGVSGTGTTVAGLVGASDSAIEGRVDFSAPTFIADSEGFMVECQTGVDSTDAMAGAVDAGVTGGSISFRG